ncbi:MAG: SRPBCC domain-containing protein [Planctomycetota bacterium]|nr:SRPBCC domain-containing protein [Planctomycetota bacterium]
MHRPFSGSQPARTTRGPRLVLLSVAASSLALAPVHAAQSETPNSGSQSGQAQATPADAEPLASERIGRVMQTINVPADRIFEHFTTAEGIKRSWSVAQARVDFRVGGEIRTAYDPTADLESPASISNTILAYEPGRMLAIKSTPPQGAPDWLQAICQSGFTVIRLEPIGPATTRVFVTGMGYKQGPLFDQALEFFQRGNDWTLQRMKESLERDAGVTPARSTTAASPPSRPDPSDVNGAPGGPAEESLSLLSSLVGGEWIADADLRGASARVRTVWTPLFTGIPHNRFFLVQLWASAADERMQPVAQLIFGPGDAPSELRFWSFSPTGETSSGPVTRPGDRDSDKSLAFDIGLRGFSAKSAPATAANQSGAPSHGIVFPAMRHVRMQIDRSRYWIRAWDSPEQVGQAPTTELAFRHVSEAPKAYKPGAEPQADLDPAEPIRAEAKIQGTVADVWRSWTTSQGISEFLGCEADIELKPGGKYELYFRPELPEGERGSDGCTVVSFIEHQELVFTWNAPRDYPHARRNHTKVTLRFEPAGEDATKVTLIHDGHAAKAAAEPDHAQEWLEVRDYFAQAWPRVLNMLDVAYQVRQREPK